GLPLDFHVDRAYPDGDLTGLIPSLLGWFHRKEDGVVPWKCILPGIGCTSIAPILICPDDLDYSCTTIVVEIAAEEEEIRWERFGFDASPPRELVCTWVRWIPEQAPF